MKERMKPDFLYEWMNEQSVHENIQCARAMVGYMGQLTSAPSTACTAQDYRVLSAGQDNTVRIWDPFDMVCLRVLKETRSELTALTFFAAGNTPITGELGRLRFIAKAFWMLY